MIFYVKQLFGLQKNMTCSNLKLIDVAKNLEENMRQKSYKYHWRSTYGFYEFLIPEFEF